MQDNSDITKIRINKNQEWAMNQKLQHQLIEELLLFFDGIYLYPMHLYDYLSKVEAYYQVSIHLLFEADTPSKAADVTCSCISIRDNFGEYSTTPLNRRVAAFAIRSDLTYAHPDLPLQFAEWVRPSQYLADYRSDVAANSVSAEIFLHSDIEVI